MGVGIAYPIKDFDTLNVDICRLSDERACGWPREKPSEEESGAKGFRQKIVQKITSFAVHTMQSINNGLVKRLGYAEKENPWEISEKRFNVLLTVVLRFRTGDTFSVSNYHMPCAFWAPAVMNIHAEMAAKRVQDLAADSRRRRRLTITRQALAATHESLTSSPSVTVSSTASAPCSSSSPASASDSPPDGASTATFSSSETSTRKSPCRKLRPIRIG